MNSSHSTFWRRWVKAAKAPSSTPTHSVDQAVTGSSVRPLALEQRFMFDGAGASDAVHAAADAHAGAMAMAMEMEMEMRVSQSVEALTTVVNSATLSNDTGTSNSDFVTNIASQTISGSLSSALGTGEKVQVSYDSGTTWIDATSYNVGFSSWSTTTTLSGSNTFEARVTNAYASSTAYTHSYTLDTAVPITTISSIQFSNDRGSSSSDFITNIGSQIISATLSSTPDTGDKLFGSFDNGVTWVDISAQLSGATLSWGGLSLSGNNTLMLKVTDVAGNDGTATSQRYTIDTMAPLAPSTPVLASASDTGVSQSDGITNITTPTFTGTAESGSTVTLYDIDGMTVLGSIIATGSNWSITSSTLAPGEHNLTVKATDAAGNQSAPSATLNITIDTNAPTGIALSTNTVATNMANAGATIATLSASDLTSVTYKLALGNGTNDTNNGSFQIDGNTLQVGAATLTAGTYCIYLQATDAAGNASYLAHTVTVQDSPTVSSIVRTGGASAFVLGSATQLEYTVTFSEAVTGVDSSDFVLTSTRTAYGSITGVSGSGTTYTITVSALSGDGTIRLDLRSGGTGIQGSASINIAGGYTAGETFTLDHTVPATPSTPTLDAASDTGASSNDRITRDTRPTFTGTAESGSTVTLYDTDGITVLGTATATGGIWSITSRTLEEGGHNLTFKATDAAGNTSAASQVLSITIDTATPTPSRPELSMGSDSGVSDSDGITNITTPTFTGAAEAGSIVTLYDTDGITELGTITADSNGKWSIIPSSALAQGTHTLTVKATDVAGNTSAASPPLNITIDTTAPTTYIASLTLSADTGTSNTDFITKTGTQAISGTLSANLQAGEMVYVSTDNGITWSLATSEGLNGWSISNCTLSAGSSTLLVKVSDTAGNNGSVLSQAYTLDTTPPTAPTVTAQTTQSVTPILSGNATLATGESLIVSVGGATYNVTPAAGAWTLDLATAVPASGTLTLVRNQEYSVVATVTDIAGNNSSGSAKLITGTTTIPENVPLGGNALPPAAVVPPEPAHSTVPDYAYLGLLAGATPSGGAALFLGGRDFGASAFSTASEVREGWMQSMLESSTFNRGTFSPFIPANLDLQTGLQGMRLLPPVVEIMVGTDSTIVWQLPPSTLVGMDVQATVKLSMTQADGQPLPAWIKFDARTGELSGTMPPGFEGALTLRLTARDSQGNTVVKTIHLKASDVAPQGRAGMAEQLQRHAQLRAGQVMAQRLHL